MSKQKDRGTRAETAVVGYLNDAGFPYAERRALRGALDCGDITGIPATCIEAKDWAKIVLSKILDETIVETRNAKAAWGVAWIKRRGRANPADWYVLTDGRTFVTLLKSALGIEDDAAPVSPQVSGVPGQLDLLDEVAS